VRGPRSCGRRYLPGGSHYPLTALPGPIVGWGIGVVMNAWDVYRDDEIDEAQIREEIERLKK
jgi:hypothetical protein